ncbi:MAG: hypothetical protein FJW56_11685, partial [Actinobacteria bacterium]|nr:hypothetical protein [Actinomycetota bacterium]
MSNNFKQTDIGLIPDDWEVLNISEVSKFSRGISWRKSEESVKGILVISIPNIRDGSIKFNSKFNHYINKNITDNKKLLVGDIVFVGSSGSIHNIGRNALINYLPFDIVAFASFTFKAKVNKEKIDNNFFYFLVNSPIISFQKYTKRSADGKFNFQLQEFQRTAKIPYMPLPEQKKIAYVLSKIQQAIETQEQIIKTTQELKKALMQKLFTEGLNGEPQKQTEIGLIPKSWEVVMISSLGDIVTGTTPRTAIERYYIPKEIDFIAPADIGKTKYIYDSEKKISNEGLTVIRPLPKGSVLCVCIGSSIGKVGLSYKNISTTNQQVNSIVCNQNYNSEFIYYLFSYYADYWRRFASPNPVPILSKGKFEQIEMPVSKNLNAQTKIAQILSSIDGKIEFSANSKNILMDLFQSTLNQLMTGQIRVKDIEFEIEKTQLSLLEKGR